MKIQESTVHKLERSFERRTASRRTILSAVVAWPGHFSAEELCKALPQIGRATIYRTLSSLQETGVLCRVMVDIGPMRYQLGGHKHHHHLICVECGNVQAIAGCGVDDFVQGVAAKFGYEPEGHRLEIYGRCSACRNEQETS